MTSSYHRHIRSVAVMLVVLLMITYVKLRFLSDPADVDTKASLMAEQMDDQKDKSSITQQNKPTSNIPTSQPTKEPTNSKKANKPTKSNKPSKHNKKPGVKVKPTPTPVQKESPTQAPQKKGGNVKQKNTSPQPTDSPKSDTSATASATTSATTKAPQSVALTPQPTKRSLPNNRNSTQRSTTLHFEQDFKIKTPDDFVTKYCNLESAEWVPSTNGTMWQNRAPYAVLAGTLEAGIPNLLSNLLKSSPNTIMANRNLNFFLPKRFRYYLTAAAATVAFSSDSSEASNSNNKRTKVWSARQHLHAKEYRVKELKQSPTMKALDASTSYLFWSTTVPQHLMCTCPWTKLIVILRNPLERLLSHYQSATTKYNLRLTLQDWVEEDLEALRDAGVTITAGATSTTAPSEAWNRYLQTTKREGPIGRGLYSIQLQQWFAVLKSLNKLNDDNLLILEYQDWIDAPSLVLLQVLEFLQVDNNNTTLIPPISKTSSLPRQSLTMDDTLRKQLTKFYKPYNEQLFQMLGWTNAPPKWD